MNKPELLAPAGDLERLKIAIIYGADAVYFGGPALGLRANANNFSMADIKEATLFAHKHHAKVYVTVNIIMHNKELKGLIKYLKQLDAYQVDAIIVSDLAVVKIAKENTNLDIHLSTQASTLNLEAVKYYESLGLKRIIMAREATRDDLQTIIANTKLDIEVFIHGAMCASYSGRCVLSNYLTDRDANRGGCAQICRWSFELRDDQGKPISDKPFTFCPKDLAMYKYIPDMIKIGIKSFKIEGRMRSLYYIATVVSIYRKLIDTYYDSTYQYTEADIKSLEAVANRDAIAQFYNGDQSSDTNYYLLNHEPSNQDFLAIVLGYNKHTKMIRITERNHFEVGDTVELFGPNQTPVSFVIDAIYNQKKEVISVANHPKEILYLDSPVVAHKYDLIRRKRD